MSESDGSNGHKRLAFFYEHPEWFKPLFAELDRRGVAYDRLLAHEHRYDPAARTTPYALFHLQPRGQLFEGPGAVVYEGMIVGEHNLGADIFVNVTKECKVADVRSRGQQQPVSLMPPAVLTVGTALAWIDPDELVEVTPETVRVRKSL